MTFLTSLQKTLMYLNEHWSQIIICVGLVIALYKKVKTYLGKSTDEKVAIAMKQIKVKMLELVTQAELDYETWVKAGEIKRSQVIGEIFEMYPILNRVTDQETLIAELDEYIKNALVIMREVFSENSANDAVVAED